MSHRKSNIFTANLNHSELQAALDSRLTSRIYETATVIELRGADKRSFR